VLIFRSEERSCGGSRGGGRQRYMYSYSNQTTSYHQDAQSKTTEVQRKHARTQSSAEYEKGRPVPPNDRQQCNLSIAMVMIIVNRSRQTGYPSGQANNGRKKLPNAVTKHKRQAPSVQRGATSCGRWAMRPIQSWGLTPALPALRGSGAPSPAGCRGDHETISSSATVS